MMNATTAREMTNNAIATREQRLDAEVKRIVETVVEPAIKLCAEEGRDRVMIPYANLQARGYDLSIRVERICEDNGFKTDEDSAGLFLMW